MMTLKECKICKKPFQTSDTKDICISCAVTPPLPSPRTETVTYSKDIVVGQENCRWVYLAVPFPHLPTQTDLVQFSLENWELVTIIEDKGINPNTRNPYYPHLDDLIGIVAQQFESGYTYKAYFKKYVQIITEEREI